MVSRVVRPIINVDLFVPCRVRLSVRDDEKRPLRVSETPRPEVLWNLHGALSPGIYFDAASASNDTRPSRCAVRENGLILPKECLERILVVQERRLAGFPVRKGMTWTILERMPACVR